MKPSENLSYVNTTTVLIYNDMKMKILKNVTKFKGTTATSNDFFLIWSAESTMFSKGYPQ